MEDTQVEGSKITKKKEFENFDLNAYKRETFGMYYGEKMQLSMFFRPNFWMWQEIALEQLNQRERVMDT